MLVVGIGSIGLRHARNLGALGVSELALLRRRPEPVVELPGAPVFTDLAEALAWQPDGVVICTPAPFHLGAAAEAVRRGCAVFVEKPLADAWEGVPNLIREADVHGSTVMVGFDLRFDAGLQRLHEMVASGALGRVLTVEALVGQHLADWRPGRDHHAGVTARADLGGGVLLELCHELDAVSWLAGSVASLQCDLGRLTDVTADVEDVATILLRFDSGAMGTVSLDCVRRPASRVLRVVGEAGTATWDGLARRLDWWTTGAAAWESYDFSRQSRDDRLRAEIAHFLACATGGAAPPVGLRQGAAVLRLSLAARAAAAQGRRVAPAEIGEVPS